LRPLGRIPQPFPQLVVRLEDAIAFREVEVLGVVGITRWLVGIGGHDPRILLDFRLARHDRSGEASDDPGKRAVGGSLVVLVQRRNDQFLALRLLRPTGLCRLPVARSTPPPARHRINVARRPGLDGYLSDFWEYPFQTHSMACGRNCCWALLTLCRAPRQNRY
jgi:hypothetical protein